MLKRKHVQSVILIQIKILGLQKFKVAIKHYILITRKIAMETA